MLRISPLNLVHIDETREINADLRRNGLPVPPMNSAVQVIIHSSEQTNEEFVVFECVLYGFYRGSF